MHVLRAARQGLEHEGLLDWLEVRLESVGWVLARQKASWVAVGVAGQGELLLG